MENALSKRKLKVISHRGKLRKRKRSFHTESVAADWDLLLNELRFRKDLKWAKQESLLRFVRFQNVSHSNRGRTLRYEVGGISGWS